jgi:hypothetical protein
MNGRVATLLTGQENRNERPTLQNSPSSEIEREVLALLQSQAEYPPSWQKARSKLLSSYTKLEIRNALISLVDQGKVFVVQGCGHQLDLALISSGLGSNPLR